VRPEEILAAQQYVIQPDRADEELPEEGQPTIIAEMPTEIPTLTVSQAVMRMDLADQPVQMFRDRTSGRLNVVYRRRDGNIGWIDPSERSERTSDSRKTKAKAKTKGKK
jgi:hypothetical protein